MKKIILSLGFILTFSFLQQLKAQLSFATAINYSVGTNPCATISADFNGDAIADLVVANQTTNDISILIGSGTGTFSAAVNYSVGSSPKSVAAGDFNNDGKIDLVTANSGSNDVSILLGYGTGTFSTATTYSAGTGARWVVSADFDGDSDLDLAVANNGSNNVSILLGSGTGNFAPPVNYPVGSTPWALTLADFNGDSKTDLAVTNGGSGNVSILLGSGTGTFSAAVNYPVSTNPRGITFGDFNDDGKVDLVTSNLSASNDVSILTGSGTGTFSAAVNYTVGGTFPVSVTSADYDIDGFIDLATTNSSTGNVSILRGNGIGTFSAVATYSTATNAFSGASADFNGDGKIDLAVANLGSNNLSILINTSIPLVPNSNFLISNPKCVNGPITFTDKSTYSPTNWAWSFPGGSPSSSSSQNPIVTYSAAGTYSAVLTASNGIGAGTSLTQTFVVNANPIATASNTGTLTCTTTTLALNGGSAGLTYLWSGPGITGSTTTQNTSVNTGGMYSLLVTNTLTGCSNTATTIVTQNTISPSITGGVTGTLNCVTSSVNAISSTTTTSVLYNWSGTGIISGGTTPTITVNQSGIFNYTVTNSSNGCTSTGTRIVSQNTVSPSGVNAGMDQLLTCSTTTVTLSGSVSSPTNATFNWTGGVCGSPTSSITSACSPNMYTLTVTDPINGCNGTDIMQVTANVAIPTVTLSSNSATLTCSSTTVSITSTTTTTPVSYSWSPASGIVGGSGSTNTPYFNAPGSYSLVVTDLINGCSTNISSNVVNVSQNIFIPSITISASPSVICSGNSSTLTAFAGSDIDYNWLPGALNGAAQTVNPNATTLYTVVTTNTITGCANSETITLTVNATPTISISGNTLICKGSTSSLTGSGATSYTWNSGANTSTINVTPTITTTYTLSGDNGNGCFNSIPTTISIIPNKTISGVITSTTGATTGDLILYKYTPGLSMWDSITTVPLSSSYSFASIDSSLYVIRAIPTATNIQVTYADSATTWQNATVINHGCTNNTNQNIKLIPLDNLGGGPGILTGFIIQDDGFGERMSNEFKPLVPGNPIGGIVVKGGRNPGGNMFTQTTTDAAGGYTLTNIPLNIGTDHYFIYVDIPGLDTSASYHKVIDATNTVYQNLNFSVDSMYIKPIGEITTIKNNHSLLNNIISVFPNPASSYVIIQYELIQSADIQITLYDLIGNKVQEIESSGYHNKNKYNHYMKTEYLSSGIYFIKVKINNSENTIKLILSN